MIKHFGHLIIRLQYRGCKNYSVYSIIVCLKNKRRGGLSIEKLGYINPQFTERRFVINTMRLAYWIRQGASLHPTLQKYLAKFLVN